MRTENKWEEAVREKLTGVEKNLPEGDWIEFIAGSKARKSSTTRVLAICFGCGIAAAILAAVLMLPRHSMNQEYNSSELPESLLAENMVQKSEASENIIQKEQTKMPQASPERHIRKDNPESANTKEVSKASSEEVVSSENDNSLDKEIAPNESNRQEDNVPMPEEESRQELESEDTFLRQEHDEDKKMAGRHSVSISLLGAGGRGTASDRIEQDGNNGSNGSNNGKNEPSDFYEYVHRRPITFGMSISYELTPKVSIVTGVEYSQYRSSITYFNKNISFNQRVGYVGIPLRIDYQVLRANHFSVYTGFGIKADWCVKARGVEDDLTDKGLNWTAYATVGAQYEIVSGIDIFFQPELSYYLNSDGHTPQTYRTENPIMVSAVLGLRLSLGN